MQKKLHIKKGDIVLVIAGDDKSSQGRVLSVDREKNRAIVEGVNIIKRHTKANAKTPQGGIVEKEAPVHISNLQLLDPQGGNDKSKGTRIGRRIGEKGKLVRYAKKSGEEIK
ncbi:MAG: 50S ribosomal protein L24 [Bacteroidales bacterium]|jgi:large subunit ribosomal protein L24|nr:50S ribosomal protein L24 [Bacteroidales bacterium]